ncbi:MAG: response regulator transcription factor [Anaerolineae bacterium]|jgi:NarL family two-component system response regulator YdfI|nr:response regulator transcription factor [Anaerolineae bacterium]PKO03764.1 MAG: DNA-binding response regulator [Chloroflexi bacterium HGW-Chloroflexi-5]
MTIKIVIADDHLIIRQGLKLILETESDFDLVGEAGDGAEALQICAQTHPQVVLMDLRMPGMDGLTAIEKLHVDQPETAVVILTTFNEDDLLIRGLQAGAKGYLLKDTTRETLFNAIRAAARGETLLSPETMLRLLNQVERPSRLVIDDINLTEREQQVLKAVALGERSKEVAFKLGISERTVKAHLASIYNKLGVDSRAAAIAIAAQRGWLKE